MILKGVFVGIFMAAAMTSAFAPQKALIMPRTTDSYFEGTVPTSLHMVTGTTKNTKNTSTYPTQRGSEVDPRKIVAGGTGKDNLIAIRLKHILFASEELANQSLSSLRSAQMNFDELAMQISNCAETREEGGEIGWVNMKQDNQHLDLILPETARSEVLATSVKPGDIVLTSSERGYHLVQITDVMVDVRKMSFVKTRKSYQEGQEETETQLKGILGGALAASEQEGVDFKVDLTYKVETMGCQMNIADSERMEGQLQSLGLRPYDDETDKAKGKKPDMVVLNTCSIRDHAEQKVYSYIGPYAKRKREGEDVTIIVAGCVAQQEGAALLRRAPEVDLVMGPQFANRLGDLLEDVANGNQVVATEASHIMEDSTKPRRQSTVAAWVNVIYGCNERCTYCIVPTTRGVEQSRPVESIVQEVTELVAQGYKEVTLLGQNIDAYGRDMIPKRKFSDLLRTVGSIPGLKRLRFVTSHPRYMSMGVVDAVAETPTACLNFHIPPQSGSNEILEAMGRGHTRERFLQIVDRIRQKIPDAAITADMIVGFPGETEEQFQDTLKLMEEVKFDSVNTAAYSPRPNTPAAEWENQVPDEVKQDRLQRINRLNLLHAAERRARMMGREVEVLIEERNVKVPTQVMGRTTHGYIVYCDGDIDELRGKLVNVKIDVCQTYYLAGTMTEVIE
jgi:tRNA-2-methylthio-N6-dimethylallyladenosine synthase